ncbi:CoA-binding protein [Alkalibacillus haloalkaliphilus]|uniref:CoA-binding protein n=1 Tax=Alkalibacillus haloalkaliphilus TaxID=94136 RepID=UPI002936BDB8|nr:CoA-binding protein [Alkalibacillus haloalkaliphilus]MDV2580713.1 CoA-binding protein [Alkalibacillus haloalkaliphilus]
MQNPTQDTMRELLENAKSIAVVGLSDKEDRTSFQIAKAMQQEGYKIIPVNPTVDEVLGEKSYNTLAEVEENIDIINVFRRSEHLVEVAEDALNTNCKVFWAQQGIVNEEADELLKENEFTVIMDSCIKVVHAVTVGK